MTRDYAVARRRLVREQLEADGITDPRVLAAMREVPRHRFVPSALQHRAYESCALPIGYDQTISQPFMVGLMTALLELKGDETVLEIGTGSGYQAAILSRLAGRVITIERVVPLADRARAVLAELGCDNVTVLADDGSEGYEPAAPYDGIMVTAGTPATPAALTRQLVNGGYLLVPLGDNEGSQVLTRFRRQGDGLAAQQSVLCRFVPLRRGMEEGTAGA